ncbi:MAG: hypothetical protein AMR96_03710 [Candidatus Adiutrix intracellularis]|jgi:hypothetical protein|nr:MAG: hypothetical protein AMR96_03710 [Candidatus Adiutrix intracellularis]
MEIKLIFYSVFFNILFDLRLIGTLKVFKQISDKFLIALYELEYFAFYKIHYRSCFIRKQLDGGIVYFVDF